MADAESIRREQADLQRQFGNWTAHNIRLAEGVYTISEQPNGDEVKLRRVTQIVSDVFGGAFEGLRVLDLACLEGMYALEFARRGAEVVAIEGREANLAKARFAARTLGLEVDFRQGDVRELDRASHGEFDVVLCLGILYHLDHPDVFEFVERMATVCRRALVVDTHVALENEDEQEHAGSAYHGHSLVEHEPSSSQEERLEALWSSLDNPRAWAPTRPSLLSLLARSGFTSAYECWVPAEPEKTPDRVTILALRGKPETELVTPAPPADPATVPERPPLGARLLPGSKARSLGRAALPRPLRARVRKLLGMETRRY